MSYLLILFLFCPLCLALGLRMGGRLESRFARAPLRMSLGLISLAGVWWATAVGARVYSNGMGPGWRWAETYALSGKWFVFAGFMLFHLGASARQVKEDSRRRVGLVALELLVLWMLVWQTMPVYVWLPRHVARDENGHIRQTIEFTCGPVSLGNLMEWWGLPSPSERDLARVAGTTYQGTTVEGMIRAAKIFGFHVRTCRPLTVSDLRALRHPAIVQISTLPGLLHATLLTHFSPEGAHFIDPAYGQRTISVQRLERILTGKSLELTRIDE